MVEIIDAYVDGRPIPRFSSSLTNAASVKRAGGLVKCCLGSSCSNFSISPTFTSGNVVSSFLPDGRCTNVQPAKRKVRPFAFSKNSPALTLIVLESYFAGII